MQGAHQPYLDTPDAERVYSVPEALRLLAEYVVLSIAVGARTLDTQLVATLPGLLEPFTALSPALDVIWRNATATYRSHCECRYAEALVLWRQLLEKLETMTDELQHLEPIRGAVTFAVGIMEAQFGLAAASQRAARLDSDPYQKLTALQLRKIPDVQDAAQRGSGRVRQERATRALRLLCVAWRARAGHLYERTAAGLSLRASLESLTPGAAARLHETVQRFLVAELERVGSMDDMATSALQDVTSVSTIELADGKYDLMLLSCVEGMTRKVVGVVALGASSADARDSERFQLIPAVAVQLLGG